VLRLASCVCTALIVALPGAAQTPAPVYTPTSLASEPGLPRTPDGHPDFQGVVWAGNFLPLLEATPMTPSLTLPEAEAKATAAQFANQFANSPGLALDPEAPDLIRASDGFALVRGERRTRALVLPADGKMPYATDAGKEISSYDSDKQPTDNPEERSLAEQCIGLSLPPTGVAFSINPRQFVQTPAYVVVHAEYGDEAYIAPFAAAHGPTAAHPQLGDAIARWDGDTLVIETIGLRADHRVRGFPLLMVGGGSKVIERFTRLSRDELLYQFTIEDPSIYAGPWLAEYSLYRSTQRLYEFACHEGNYSLPNILLGQRVREARAVKAKP
jgi:hypothetical protein